MPIPKWSILGTVGVPGNYGGFETLAENLVRFHANHDLDSELSVYCSSKAYDTCPAQFERSELRYIGLEANGPQSILYDMLSLFDAVRRQTDVILLLGVSGALALPLVRAFSRCRVVTNIDGIEWRREKWSGLSRLILRWSEYAAVRWSHCVIADNLAIAEHVKESYGRSCQVIAYGGDHALSAEPVAVPGFDIPHNYVFSLCRIEPENNVDMILEAFSNMPNRTLLFVGNWEKSEYGRVLRARFGASPNLNLLDPVYDPGHLRWLRDGAGAYVHGHSAGGTNPSLVEMMQFGVPIYAYDCSFNRRTTEEKARYFTTADELVTNMQEMRSEEKVLIGEDMMEVANRRYTWEKVGYSYFELLGSLSRESAEVGKG